MITLQANNQNVKLVERTIDEGQVSGKQPGGRWFESSPRYQGNERGSLASFFK